MKVYELIALLGQMPALDDVFFCFQKGNVVCEIDDVTESTVIFKGNGK